MRRRELISSTATLSIVGPAGIVGAKERGNPFAPSGKNSDLHQKMSKAFREEGSDGVESILSQSDRSYSHSSALAKNGSRSHDKVGKLDRYVEEDSELSTATVTIPHTDQISVHVMMNLKNVEASLGSATYAEDAIGVAYNSDHWSSVGEPVIYAEDPHSGNFFSGSLGGNGGGVIGEIDLEANPVVLPTNSYVELYAELENLDGVAGTVLGYYEHFEKFTTLGSGAIQGVEILTDNLGVNIDSGAYSLWDIADPNDPEDALKR